jgi:hypothetical protein
MGSKKRSVGASERDEVLRAAWRTLVAGEICAERLVFVDEMRTNTSLAPLYGWSRRGRSPFLRGLGGLSPRSVNQPKLEQRGCHLYL